MQNFVVENFGIEPWVAIYILMPLLVFCARIFDVSAATLRVIFIMHGNKKLAPILGFFESLIWLTAISQILQNIDNIFSYIAFPAGFAAGTYVGLIIEERLALGNVLVRVISPIEAVGLIDFLKGNDFNFTNIPAEGRFGKVNVLFFAIRREKLTMVLNAIKSFNPKAFYTIESVKRVSDYHIGEKSRRLSIMSLLNIKRR
ncbi:MAG TPA: DUF5698 domain-containing protein [Cyclobacteriaceae bacterium]|nr:DUF5698 domain-containing protein [Cyclobacteriaceae bacterium]